jgi:hypothetical protein
MAFASGGTIMPGLHYSMDTAAAAYAATAMRVKRLRRQRAIGHWQSALAKLEHKEKSKAVLGELVSKSRSAQLDKFNAWYEMPIGAAEDDEYRRMVSEDNRFLRWWQARLWWLKDPHCYDTHKDKLKVVLEELVKSHRDQLEHFNEWFDDWGTTTQCT